MATHEIPSDKTRIDRSFSVIQDFNDGILLKIAEDPSSGLVNKFYKSCMDTAAIEKLGGDPVREVTFFLDNGIDKNSSIPTDSALLIQRGLEGLFNFRIDIDALNPSTMIYTLSQGGLTLPDPSYYSDPEIYKAYVKHVDSMLRLMEHFDHKGEAQRLVAFEAGIANITVPPEDLFDPFKSYNRMSWADLVKLAPNLYFDQLAERLNLDTSIPVALDAPKFYSDLSLLIEKSDRFQIADWFYWRVVNQMAPLLSSSFVKTNFEFFGTFLTGQKVMPPRFKTCLAAVNSVVPELAGSLYAKIAFPQASKKVAEEIFDSILTAFELGVNKLDWMDPQTLKRALTKLNLIERLIGYPDHPRQYSNYTFNEGYAANSMAAGAHEWIRNAAQAGKASVRNLWTMPPAMINAQYDPLRNVETLPAGIIQAPYFDPNYPPAMNYGGIGMVGGHELTHSLDSQGRDYNGQGKLEDWWDPSTSAAFQKRVDCIIEQYSKFSPLPGYFVNGNLTQGENIADTGGLKTTHAAFMTRYPQEGPAQSIVPGLTNEQLLFVGYAQTWCSKLTPNVVKQRLLTDPHSPPHFRVNGPMMNLPAFASAFNCPAGSPMNPSDRCQIW